MELANTNLAKAEQATEKSQTENFSLALALDFAPTASNRASALQELNTRSGDTTFLPSLQLDGDKPESLLVKDAVNTFKESGPAATLQLLRADLAAFEKDAKLTLKLPSDRGGAGFDEETANKIASEKSDARWQAVKTALLEQDPNAIEKLKVAYLDNTLNAMSAASSRYGNLDQYGVSGQAHFESQKSNGSSAMIREFANKISSEYSSIADPRGTDTDGKLIDKRELESYKAKQALNWHK